MNAKKIMGAVLVALLAAALFVGAGAAVADGETVFVNQNVTGLSGTWTSGTNSITAIPSEDGGYFTGNIVEGAYTNGTGDSAITITVKYPAISVVGLANYGKPASEYQFIPGTLYAESGEVDVAIKSLASDASLTFKTYLTYPNGTELNVSKTEIEAALEGSQVVTGQYSIRAVFDSTGFINGTLVSDLITKPVTFTLVDADAATISASADQVLKAEPVKLTITGKPGAVYNVTYDEYAFTVPAGQLGLPTYTNFADNKGFNFTMPNTGKVEFAVKANASAVGDSEKIKVEQKGKDKSSSVTIKFEKGTLTAKADAASYFVGDVVKITGTTTAGDIQNVTIKGTNFKAEVTSLIENLKYGSEVVKTFEFELNTAVVNDTNKKLDVGTYTLTIKTNSDAETTVALVMKQPFISIAEAPEVVVQGDEAEFIINAEAATKISYYIFGTNFFTAKEPVEEHPEDEEGEDIENQFVVKLDEKTTKNMSAGQYFAVFQHPMYDTAFNVTGYESNWTIVSTNGVKIDVKERQTANAAQALCDELDAQNIDDMYVKASFFVVGEDESFTISEIPTTVAQGDTITISGVSTANADKYVTVEMISTAFAAVPKETVGSAAFIAVTTQIADDGTWEVTFDTSDLNVDEYSLSVACGDETWKNVKINVVEGADEPDTPVTPVDPVDPVDPVTPTEPTTPGFGALAALAGLGAVAVLLLRRE